MGELSDETKENQKLVLSLSSSHANSASIHQVTRSSYKGSALLLDTPGMASTSSQPNPLPRTLTLSESLFPPPEPWTPRTFTFNLSKVEHLPHGETKPLTWTAVDGESSLRFSIAARPYKVTLVRECTGEKIEELLGWTPLDFLAVRVSSI